MPASSDLSFGRVRAAPPVVHLMSWPLRDEPLRTAAILTLEIAFAVGAADGVGHWSMGLLVLGLLLIASWSLWLPTKIELGPKGIVRSVFGWWCRIAWLEFARYETHSHGVFLWPWANDQPFSAVRGLYLPSKSPHTELLAALECYLRPREAESNSIG